MSKVRPRPSAHYFSPFSASLTLSYRLPDHLLTFSLFLHPSIIFGNDSNNTMGWWWSTSDIDRAHLSPTSSSGSLPDPQVKEPSLPITTTPTPVTEPEASKRPLTRDEQTNQELVRWLREIQAESEHEQRASKSASSLPPDSSTIPAPEDISPDSLYPTDISCRSAFDYAFFCQSFGGQFVNVYRYGDFRSCSNHWQDFWLCMRTRQWKDQDRKKAIQDHYRKKAIKYKTGPSSEDVWDVRTEPVQDAFQGDLEEIERQIEEWKKTNPGSDAVEQHFLKAV